MTASTPGQEQVTHPAKFSSPVLPEISAALDAYARRSTTPPRGRPRGAPGGRVPRLRVLDPFAGTGLIHTIDQHDTWAVEIEPEWATMHPRTIVGDATVLPFPKASFDAVATSPTYGNRLADQYDGRGTCRACKGDGLRHKMGVTYLDQACERCGGEGRDNSKRYTYRLALGRPLHPRNTGRMQWGPAYWHMHWSAWVEARRVLRPGGLMALNISNHYRGKELMPVVGWHRARLQELGFVYRGSVEIETRRMRHGANHDARDESEHLLTFTAPPIPRS